MSNTYWTATWSLLGPVLLIQIVTIAIAMAIGAIIRTMGYRGYVELGPDISPEHYTHKFLPARGAESTAESEPKIARIASEPPWREMHWRPDSTAAVRQYWLYPERPSPARDPASRVRRT
jgi:hypothetical protein